MTILKTLAILLSVGAATLPGMVLGEVIECKMAPGFNRWYIAPVIRVEIGEGGTVKVRDDLIKSTGRKSVFGKVAKDSEKLLVVAWELRGLQVNPADKVSNWQTNPAAMRLVIKRPDLTASLTVQVPLYRVESFHATGTCSFEK